MRIHHLNCGTCCPAGGRLFDGTSDAAFGHLVCHCLLIESDAGLILVDTGFGTRDIDHPLVDVELQQSGARAKIAAAARGFAVSSYDGQFERRRSDVAWDQHIVRVEKA